jgi:hypothetical protein
LYAAVSAIDLAAVRALVAREAERLLDDAMAAGGQVDIVNGYARLVAARAARQIFGLAGPTEMDLMRVIRAVFQHTFLNLTGDEQVRQRALAASEELGQWFVDEIARRHSQGLRIDDVIGRLLALRGTIPDALDDDGVRRNVAGLLVGAIDTTATAVAKIIRMASTDEAVLARVERAVDDPSRMIGWCNELLRLWTHNPVLLRRAAACRSAARTFRRDRRSLHTPRPPCSTRIIFRVRTGSIRRAPLGSIAISAVASTRAPAGPSTTCRYPNSCARSSSVESCVSNGHATTGLSSTN